MQFSHVPPEHLDFVWQQIAPMVARGLARLEGGGTGEALRESVRRGERILWAIHEGPKVRAACVFSIRRRAGGLVMFVDMLAGRDMDAWVDELIRLLGDYRDLIGAKSIEASCRPGLARYLARKGWTRKAVVMRAPDGG